MNVRTFFGWLGATICSAALLYFWAVPNMFDSMAIEHAYQSGRLCGDAVRNNCFSSRQAAVLSTKIDMSRDCDDIGCNGEYVTRIQYTDNNETETLVYLNIKKGSVITVRQWNDIAVGVIDQNGKKYYAKEDSGWTPRTHFTLWWSLIITVIGIPLAVVIGTIIAILAGNWSKRKWRWGRMMSSLATSYMLSGCALLAIAFLDFLFSAIIQPGANYYAPFVCPLVALVLYKTMFRNGSPDFEHD